MTAEQRQNFLKKKRIKLDEEYDLNIPYKYIIHLFTTFSDQYYLAMESEIINLLEEYALDNALSEPDDQFDVAIMDFEGNYYSWDRTFKVEIGNFKMS